MPYREAHIKRYQVALAFVALIIVFGFSLWKVQHDSASITQLEKTDCGLKQFLLTARIARVNSASHETGVKRRQDLQAAQGYLDLANRFTAVGEHCNVPVG